MLKTLIAAVRCNHLQLSLSSAPRVECNKYFFFRAHSSKPSFIESRLPFVNLFLILSLFIAFLKKRHMEMVIRCAAAVKSLLLKCCAPPNNPVSHSKTSSIWFLDHRGAGSVMVGTSDLSAAVLCAPSPTRPWHT